MARTRLLVLIALAVIAALFLMQSQAAGPPVGPGSVHFAPVNHHRLQADEEGDDLPQGEFTANGFLFNGFILHPDVSAILASVRGSVQRPSAPCPGPTL